MPPQNTHSFLGSRSAALTVTTRCQPPGQSLSASPGEGPWAPAGSQRYPVTPNLRNLCSSALKTGFERIRWGNPLQYSCLENPMDTGAWQATVQGSQSRTRLHFHFGQLWPVSHTWPTACLKVLLERGHTHPCTCCLRLLVCCGVSCAVCSAQSLSPVRHCGPRIAAHQDSLSMGILWGKRLEWVAMPSSRGSSQTRDLA